MQNSPFVTWQVLEGDSICQMHAEVQESVTDIAKFGKIIKLVSFQVLDCGSFETGNFGWVRVAFAAVNISSHCNF